MPPTNDNQNSNFNQQNQGFPPVNNPNTQISQDDGKTLSIIGLALAFFWMQLIGLILSIIGFNKAKKAGAPKGVAIAGIILNIIGMIVGLVLGVALLVGAFKTDLDSNPSPTPAQKDTSVSSVKTDQSSSNNSKALAVTASDIYDMSKACKNNYSISNSGSYMAGSVNKLVTFYNTNESKNIYSYLQASKDLWVPESVSQVGLIVCADSSEGQSTGKSCDYVSDDEQNLSIPLYNTNYKLRVIEAYTGKQITTLDVTTNSTDCPSYATYNKNEPKVYQILEFDAIEGSLTPYAG